MTAATPEQREFVRVPVEFPVRYKLLSSDPQFSCKDVLTGVAKNISGGGILLHGTIPGPAWIDVLLSHRVIVGLSLDLPDDAPPVRVLTRAAWIESIDPDDGRYAMGLLFREITRTHQDRIFQAVIQSQDF